MILCFSFERGIVGHVSSPWQSAVSPLYLKQLGRYQEAKAFDAAELGGEGGVESCGFAIGISDDFLRARGRYVPGRISDQQTWLGAHRRLFFRAAKRTHRE